MSENTPENVSSELVDLGEVNYGGFDPKLVEAAVLHNMTRLCRSKISNSAANAMGLAMLRVFKLDPTPADYEKVLADLMQTNAIVQDMLALIEQHIPFDSDELAHNEETKQALLKVIDKHPIIQMAFIRVKETSDEKLERAMRQAKQRFPHNG
jgi:hypothetical protein